MRLTQSYISGYLGMVESHRRLCQDPVNREHDGHVVSAQPQTTDDWLAVRGEIPRIVGNLVTNMFPAVDGLKVL